MPTSSVTDRLLAFEEIRQLAAHYAIALDRRDLDELVGLFVDDVRVGKEQQGRAALKTFFDASLRTIQTTILNVGTHAIDLHDEDHATGSVYCRAEMEQGDRWIVQAICYLDDYQRRDGHWFFVRRRHLLYYGADAKESPMRLPPANWPEHDTGKGTLPEAWPTWAAFWQKPGAG